MPPRKLENRELNRLNVDEFKGTDKIPMVLVLDNVRSLHNIGSVFRTADAFLIERIFLCGITATPPDKDIHKTALGATESVDWEYHGEASRIVRKLMGMGYTAVAVEQAEGSVKLNDFKWDASAKYALVFGNEVKGVSQEIVSACDMVLEIPQHGTKHSLNISVSVGIVVWDLWVKLNSLQEK